MIRNAAHVALLLFAIAPATAAADASTELAPLVQRIKQVGREGQGNVEASKAWKELVRFGPNALPAILHGMNDADATALNWLRTAVEAIAEREVEANRPLPAAELETYIRERKNSPMGRRIAYQWLCRADKTTPARLLPTMLDDPSAELRRDAVDVVQKEAKALLDKGDKDAAAKAFRRAFEASRDRDQVIALGKQLAELGVSVDIATHFGFIREWHLLASFDSRKGIGYAAAYPPEEKVDLKAAYRDRDGNEIRWKPAKVDDAYGKLDLNKLIGAHKGAVAYAYAVVEAPGELKVELRAASPNAIKIYLNGKQVFGREEYHHGSRMDAHVAAVTLKPGRNEILLKVCQNEQTEDWAQAWQFQFRICDAVGGATPVKVAGDRPGQGGEKELQKLRQELKEKQKLLEQERKESDKLRAEIMRLKGTDSKEDQVYKAMIKKLEAELAAAEGVRRAPYVHAVMFYLKKDAPTSEVDSLLKDSGALLGKIPSVKALWFGKPAKQATPDVAAKDYHVGLLVLFDDYKGLKEYLDHPLHQKFLDRHKQYWDKTPVYDFERARGP
jgi:hypothetical protein